MTPAETISAVYDRLASETLNPVWISLVPRAAALEMACALERNPAASSLPLYGVPFAVKDNIDVAGVPTTAGCPAYSYKPEAHSTVVRRLIAAGAIPVGKTNLDQFATGLVGTRSPYGACSSVFDSRYISGGSSSGSAVAAAKGLVTFSLGTDTAGSGRVPAAFNGIVGLKPTRGLLSTSGVVPACRSLDCVSIFARTIADARAAFRAGCGFDAADPYSRAPRPGEDAAPWSAGPFRFGVPPAAQLEFFGDSEAAHLYANAIDHLAAIGGEKVEIDFAPFRAAADLLYSGPWVAERYSTIGAFLEQHGAEMNPVVRGIIEQAVRYTAVDAFRAEYRLRDLARAAEAQWTDMDVLAVPTTGTIYSHEQVAADPVRLNTNLGYYTNFVNLLDLAAIAVPAGLRPNGLPFGISFLGRAFTDEGLLTIAERFVALARGAPDRDSSRCPACPPGCVRLAVVGAHLTGMPLNRELTAAGARLLAATRTAPGYRLYHLAGTAPPKPGLVRDDAFRGPGIEVEVWAVPYDSFGRFVAAVPPPLGIGSATLHTGEVVKCFICEGFAVHGATEITGYGGWRKYVSQAH